MELWYFLGLLLIVAAVWRLAAGTSPYTVLFGGLLLPIWLWIMAIQLSEIVAFA